MSCDNTLLVFNPDGTFQRNLSALFSEQFAVPWTPNWFFFSRAGHVWLGTTAGLVMACSRPTPFQTLLTDGRGTDARGITETTAGQLLVGGRARTYALDSLGAEPREISDYNTIGFNRQPDGSFVASSYGAQLSYFSADGALIDFSPPNLTNDGFTPVNLTVPFYDSLTQGLFCASSSGLYYRAPADSLLTLYRPPNDPTLFEWVATNCLFQDSAGIWVGSTGGIHLVEPDGSARLRLALPGVTVKHFHRNPDGSFWVATGGQGLIHWEPTGNQRWARLEVSDEGVGIDPAVSERMFTVEANESTSGTAGETGLGLGLPLSRELAQSNGGRLELVRSSARGTVFRLSLPHSLRTTGVAMVTP